MSADYRLGIGNLQWPCLQAGARYGLLFGAYRYERFWPFCELRQTALIRRANRP